MEKNIKTMDKGYGPVDRINGPLYSYELAFDEHVKNKEVVRVTEYYVTSDYELLFDKAKERLRINENLEFVGIVRRFPILCELKKKENNNESK